MKITLVRHAQVDEDYQGCYNGHNEIGLSDYGHIQAKTLSKRLDLKKFDAIYKRATDQYTDLLIKKDKAVRLLRESKNKLPSNEVKLIDEIIDFLKQLDK